MLSIHEHPTLQDASAELLNFALDPENWIVRGEASICASPGEDGSYQRRVGKLRVCAAVEVTPSQQAFLHIGFSAPGLTPLAAADHLAAFVAERLPLLPNSEWQVAVDGRRWVHFIRPYARGPERC